MAQKYTENKKASNRKWDAANLDRLSIALPKGRKEAIQSHAAAHGESVNGFIGRAIGETMERDGGGMPTKTSVDASDGVFGGGGILTPEMLELATESAQKAGEAVPEYVAGAVRLRAGLEPETLKLASEAAQKPGKTPETVPEFIRRAVEKRNEIDNTQIRMGVDPVADWRNRNAPLKPKT